MILWSVLLRSLKISEACCFRSGFQADFPAADSLAFTSGLDVVVLNDFLNFSILSGLAEYVLTSHDLHLYGRFFHLR